MNRLIIAAALLGLTAFAPADEPNGNAKQQATAKALETFTGSWEIAKVTPDGATKDARKLVFRKDGTYAAVDTDGKELWAGTFEIDPTASRKVWDHRSDDGKKKGTDVLGIYELIGDVLKGGVCGWAVEGQGLDGERTSQDLRPETGRCGDRAEAGQVTTSRETVMSDFQGKRVLVTGGTRGILPI
ncbi:TIGR03067 domain-containing protein [Limnoglobus roseus]|uniref:TIGR03067 domain-containing protein n=1 Tax=Limnoglobus roseus TaxID=2598579 RepID=A0A5C1AB96_9BACT|nr:TIGR03067 domain-containing protein [Limnoglobus roseus]QEL15497.1 TIGR03067 domain-containing protein [Limnoglobus roseus]